MASINFKKTVIATLIFSGAQIYCAWSQEMPWQSGPGQSPPPQFQSPPSMIAPDQLHHGLVNAPEQTYGAPQADEREQDDRRLNDLATKFYKATPKNPKVILKLKSIFREVKQFHAELLNRSYNAVDIIRDTENLENRVGAQLGHLEAEARAKQRTATSGSTTTPQH